MSEQDVEDCERVSNITGPRRISDAELGIAAAVFLERVFLNQTTARVETSSVVFRPSPKRNNCSIETVNYGWFCDAFFLKKTKIRILIKF